MNEREYLARLERSTPDEFLALLRRPSADEERVLRTYFGTARYERLRGSALRSRGMEPFLKKLSDQLIKFLLGAAPDSPVTMIDDYRRRITQREADVHELAKSETLNQNPEAYERLIAEELGSSLLVEVREEAAIERLASGKAAPALVRPGTGSLDP